MKPSNARKAGLSFMVVAFAFMAFAISTWASEPSVAESPKALKKMSSKKNANLKAALKNKQATTGDYSTSHSFDGAAIKGRVQEGNLHRIVIENDKSLDDLLGIRKNFDDRSKEEAQRNETW